jgi:hypothetical protein
MLPVQLKVLTMEPEQILAIGSYQQLKTEQG